MESQKQAIKCTRAEKQRKKLQSDYQELLQFFPDINVHRMEAVENFHRQLSSILSSELRESEQNIDAMITLANGVTESLSEALNKVIITEMRRVEAKVNLLMDEMNETLYDVHIKPPMLNTMNAESYEFSTEDDGGTGMRYKGMILLDIALMRTTKLPFVRH